jgi:branched-subunit amino acid transport protein
VTMWVAIIGAGVGCYLLKLAGLSVPPSVLEHRVVARVADLIPVALLAALVAVQVVADSEQRLVLDARAAALGAAVVMLLLRAPFLVVVFGSALVAALLRLL